MKAPENVPKNFKTCILIENYLDQKTFFCISNEIGCFWIHDFKIIAPKKLTIDRTKKSRNVPFFIKNDQNIFCIFNKVECFC